MLNSLWQDRHPRVPREPGEPGEPGEIDGSWDVVVVGAGITGLTTALLLARAGRTVAVLEAAYVGAGTTGRSTAKVSLLQGTQLSRIAGRHPADLVAHYVRGNTEAQAWVEQFCASADVAVQHRPAYTYATSDRGAKSARDELDAARQAGLPVSWVDRPPLDLATHGAVLLPDQLQLDPVELLEALAREATAQGVQLVEGARVRGVDGRGPHLVRTDHGVARATTVVLATNAPLLDRGGFFARVEAARSYGLAFRTPERAVDGMYLAAESPSRSLRDTPSGEGDGSLLLVGGNGHPTGREHSATERLDDLRRWTAEHFPATEEVAAWSAQDYVPHGALPYAGPVLPGADGLLMTGGYSKWGMTNGVAAAHVIAARVLGDPPTWADAYSTWSRRMPSGTLDAVRANAGVALQMGTGWVRPVLHPGGGSPAEGEGEVRLDRAGPPTAVSTTGGALRRVSAVCTHLGGLVSWNDAERSWDCPLHGSRFGPDGEVLDGPATCGLRRRD